MFKQIYHSIALVALFSMVTACNNAPEKTEAEGKEDNKEASNATASKDASNTAGKETASEDGKARLVFEKTEYDFGDVREGEKVKYKFKFKNAGDAPLIIQDAKASCGCTVPTFTKDPVAPNASGEIAVEFDSQNKPGTQSKTVTVTSNSVNEKGDNTPTVLTIKGFVKGMDANSKGPLAEPKK